MTHPLIVILAISVLLRAAAAIYLGDQVEILPGTYDQVSYHNLALRVLDGYGFSFGEPWWPLTGANEPTAHWSYLYTLYLVLIYGLFGPYPILARILQALIIGIAHPLLTYLIGRRLFGAPVGLVSAILTTFYAYFVYYTATLMTEPFYITTILASLYLTLLIGDYPGRIFAQERRTKTIVFSLLFGFILGVTILLRQVFLLLVPFLFFWIWMRFKQKHEFSPVRILLLASAVLILMITPFTIYNSLRFNRFVLLNTNAGYAFFWANHPIYGTRFLPILPSEMGDYQSLIPRELRSLDEASLDQELLRHGFHFVRSDPRRFLLLSLSRIPAYFTFWPSSGSSSISNISRMTSFGLLWPFMLFGGIMALIRVQSLGWRFVLSTDFLLLMVVGIYTTIHLLSWTLIRYRLPVDSIMILYAGLAISFLARRFGFPLERKLLRQ